MILILQLTTTFKIYRKRTKFQWNHLENEKKKVLNKAKMKIKHFKPNQFYVMTKLKPTWSRHMQDQRLF